MTSTVRGKTKRSKDHLSVVCELESVVVIHKTQIQLNDTLHLQNFTFKSQHHYKLLWMANGQIMSKKIESTTIKCLWTSPSN